EPQVAPARLDEAAAAAGAVDVGLDDQVRGPAGAADRVDGVVDVGQRQVAADEAAVVARDVAADRQGAGAAVRHAAAGEGQVVEGVVTAGEEEVAAGIDDDVGAAGDLPAARAHRPVVDDRGVTLDFHGADGDGGDVGRLAQVQGRVGVGDIGVAEV